MFELDKKKIGKYLADMIESKYDSTRQFCIDYLKKESGKEVTEEEIRNKANRISQIKSGKKTIQLYDLPYFSELLGVSFEQILSAGKEDVPKSGRMTNYTVAQSHSKKEWRDYIEKEDGREVGLGLSPDEYGKSILDYAIDFGNYDFIKFLLDEKYIWFDSGKEDDYVFTFGAGTSITYVKNKLKVYADGRFGDYWPGGDALQWKLATKDDLRKKIISLAAYHNDLKTLECLRARELPGLYVHGMWWTWEALDIDGNYHLDEAMVRYIAESSEEVLGYFTDPFEVRDRVKYRDGSNRHTFVFPYISKLLDMLIVNNSSFLQKALEKAIAYNKGTLKKLKMIIQSLDKSLYWGDGIKKEIRFGENGNFISVQNSQAGTGIVTNVIHATKKSKDEQTNSLIEKLNESYDRIRNISEESFSEESFT